jgi:hypothetical protein
VSRCGHDKGLLLEIATHLVHCTIPEHLDDMYRALKANDASAVHMTACMMIDSAETIGASTLVERISPLALRSKEGIWDSADNHVALIRFEFDRVSSFACILHCHTACRPHFFLSFRSTCPLIYKSTRACQICFFPPFQKQILITISYCVSFNGYQYCGNKCQPITPPPP